MIEFNLELKIKYMARSMKTNQNGKIISPLNSPKKVSCSKCEESFFLTFVVPKWDWSSKNNLHYWSEQEGDKDKYVCNSCLLDLYYNRKKDYWSLVSNPKKRRQMSSYIYDKSISV